MEDSLRRSDDTRRGAELRLLDALPQGVFWKDRDSVYLGCNLTFAGVAGLERPQDVEGKTDFDLPWPKEHAEAYREDDRRVIDGGTTETASIEPLQPADGSRAWIETIKVPLRDDGGQVVGLIGFFSDVTQRRAASRQLEQTQRMLQLVLDTIPVRVFWKDLDCVYLGCNLLFARDSGLEHPDQIVGQTDYEQGWADQAELYRADDFAVMKSGEAKIAYEEPQTTPDGDEIWLRTSKIPLRNPEDEIIGVLGTYEDITAQREAEAERRRLEAQVQHAQKLESLGILAGGIAHDFNNLLVAILGHADLALADLPASGAGQGHVEEIRTAAIRARELTNQMLAYSGKGRFVVKSLNLSDVVQEIGSLLEAAIPRKVTLRYNLADPLPWVEVDAAQIRQVVMNLVTNAAEAIGESRGLVTLTTGRQHASEAYLASTDVQDELPEGDYVYIEVSDDGCGMDAVTRERLFEPFFTTKFQGRGLGLAAVLGIVRGHGGTMKVYSEPGVGTSFKVLLPAAEGSPAVPDAFEASRSKRWEPLAGTALVVDDEPSVRSVASQMLRRSGLEVLTAGDGVEALEVYEAHRDDIVLVLLDMTMPRMDGEETFRELRTLDPGVRVILSSGYNQQDATSRFVGKGLAGFIQKPFTLKDLTSAVRRVLQP